MLKGISPKVNIIAKWLKFKTHFDVTQFSHISWYTTKLIFMQIDFFIIKKQNKKTITGFK